MSDITWLHSHLYVAYGVIAALVALLLLLLAVAVRVSRPHTGSRVRDDRYQGHHTAEGVVQQQWADDLADLPDPAASTDVRSVWNTDPRRALTADRPPWDSAGFPAIPRTVQTVTLPPPWPGFQSYADALDRLIASFPDSAGSAPAAGEPHRVGWCPVCGSDILDSGYDDDPDKWVHADQECIPPDFPGPSDSPARDAGAERVPAVHAAGGDPSTNLPGPVFPDAPLTASRAGEPFWRRILTYLRRPADLLQEEVMPHATVLQRGRGRHVNLPVAVTVPRAPQPPQCAGPDGDAEPVLEGIVHAGRPDAADYNADTWFADEMAKLRAWSDQGIAELEAWRHGRVLEAA